MSVPDRIIAHNCVFFSLDQPPARGRWCWVLQTSERDIMCTVCSSCVSQRRHRSSLSGPLPLSVPTSLTTS